MNVLNIYGASTWFKVLQTTDRSQTAVMSLEPGQATGEHAESHRNSQQLLLLIEGKLLAEVGGELRTIAAGDLVVIPPNVKHKFTNEGKTPALTVNVYCPPEYPPNEKG
jgi:mannose-6-phosphate isomerase-like protein (cupin superfamily)